MSVTQKYQKAIVRLDDDRKFVLSRSQVEAILCAELPILGERRVIGRKHRRSVKVLHTIGLAEQARAPTRLTHEGVLVCLELGGDSGLPDESFSDNDRD